VNRGTWGGKELYSGSLNRKEGGGCIPPDAGEGTIRSYIRRVIGKFQEANSNSGGNSREEDFTNLKLKLFIWGPRHGKNT